MRQEFIEKIDAFLARTTFTESSLGRAAIKDSKFIGGVKEGNNFTIRTAERLLDFMNNHAGEMDGLKPDQDCTV